MFASLCSSVIKFIDMDLEDELCGHCFGAVHLVDRSFSKDIGVTEVCFLRFDALKRFCRKTIALVLHRNKFP